MPPISFSETETIAAPTSGATTTSGAVPATAGWLPVTESAVASIAEIPDVAVRNLWITQTYADLAQRLAAVIATDHTWCTFAVWASGTAGQSIREEELGGVLDDILDATGPHHTAAADANHAIRWLRRRMTAAESAPKVGSQTCRALSSCSRARFG